MTGYYGGQPGQGPAWTAMQSKNYGRVLAKPKMLVNDNEPGKLKTTDITYVEEDLRLPVSPAGRPAPRAHSCRRPRRFQSPTMPASAQYHASHQRRRPAPPGHQAARGRISARRQTATRPPNTTTSEVDTAVTVPRRQHVILGGMVKLNQNKGGSKVPILGDLPLVGGLVPDHHNSEPEQVSTCSSRPRSFVPTRPPATG